MPRNELGRVVDPKALDASSGPRAYVCVIIPDDWFKQGCELDLALKKRLLCARCQGGGCDGCHCSGALRTPEDPAHRTLRLQIPEGSRAGFALRVTNPFGAFAPIEQLLVEFKPGQTPSPDAHKVRVLHGSNTQSTQSTQSKAAPRPKPKKQNTKILNTKRIQKEYKKTGYSTTTAVFALLLFGSIAFVLFFAR